MALQGHHTLTGHCCLDLNVCCTQVFTPPNPHFTPQVHSQYYNNEWGNELLMAIHASSQLLLACPKACIIFCISLRGSPLH